jgi:hypothetical protein
MRDYRRGLDWWTDHLQTVTTNNHFRYSHTLEFIRTHGLVFSVCY